MLPWFNHQATITIEKSNPEMSTDRFVWWCMNAIARLQIERLGIQNIKDRFKIVSEYKFDSYDGSIKALNIAVTGLTKKEARSVCCIASTFINEMKVTTFYQ